MTRLHVLHERHGQSPWLDDLSRDLLDTGRLKSLIDAGIRGVTANPTIIADAIETSDRYEARLRKLLAAGTSIESAYWQMVEDDMVDALELLAPLHEASGGSDGFVSLEVAPTLAYDADGSVEAAAALHDRIRRPNLLVKIPATAAGVDAFRRATAAGLSVNVTLLFSLDRYAEILDAYLDGLESHVGAGGDATCVHSVASFFLGRVDAAVDRRLSEPDGHARSHLAGTAAIAQARVAHSMFQALIRSERWARLAARGARPQRLLWASTSAKDPNMRDTRYVDELAAPGTITTLSEATIAAFEDHGDPRQWSDDDSVAHAQLQALANAGIDLGDIGTLLEDRGVALFNRSYGDVFQLLRQRAEAQPEPSSTTS